MFYRYRGNCYNFNTGKSLNRTPIEMKYSYLAGINYGLQMTIYTHHNKMLSSLVKSTGVILKIENNSYSVDSHNGYDISSGFKTKVAIERIFKTSLSKPYSSCDIYEDERPSLVDYELYDLIYHSKYTYEQQLCIGNSKNYRFFRFFK